MVDLFVLKYGVVLLVSLFILFKSADLIVYSISNYARRLGLSESISGLVVVAMAASAPEIVSSLIGFLDGRESIGFGAIIGTNMVHAGLALGLLCVLGKKISVEPNIFTKHRFVMWLALMLPFLLALDGTLSRFDGLFLVTAFVLYLLELWRIEGTFGRIKKNVQLKTIWRDVTIFLGAFVALLIGGKLLVLSAERVADYYRIPEYFVALTIIGIGTTLPDLSVELRSIWSKHASIGLGDLLGSLMLQLLLFFGIVALIRPLVFDVSQVALSLVFLAISITLVMFWLKKRVLTWKEGALLLSIYAVFLGIEIYKMI